MNLSGIRIPHRFVPLACCALALGATAIAITWNRSETPASKDATAHSGKVQADRPYLEWEVSTPLPEPTITPQPRTETERGAETPSVDEKELLLSLAAGPATVADSRRDLDAPAPTGLASNLSPGERAALLRPEVARERPARRAAAGPRFPFAVVEDNCEPPGRTFH